MQTGASRPAGCYSSQTSCEASIGVSCTAGKDCTFDEGFCIIGERCHDDFIRANCASISGVFEVGETCPTYLVTVISAGTGATGGGSYKYGDTVHINAGTPPTDDDRFVNWTTASARVTFTDTRNSTTLFIMPANEVTVTANFRPVFVEESFTDERDGQIYRIVEIGDQVWMAENLNFATDEGSWCYDDDESNCDIYGRLYDWATAMDFASTCNTQRCAGQIQTNHQGVCPTGWHLPSRNEWLILANFPGSALTSGTNLKSSTHWSSSSSVSMGTDDFGFSALPGGHRSTITSSISFLNIGSQGNWWNASEYESSNNRGLSIHMLTSYEGVRPDFYDKRNGLSVRCVRSY